MKMHYLKLFSFIAIGLFIGFFGNMLLPMNHVESIKGMGIKEQRLFFIELKNNIQGELLPQSKYRCCLKKPCSYCIEKEKDAECDCLEKIMNGKHPCGECIGEILEGHGNRFLAPYFATAISEKTGQEEAIKLIIEEKYNITSKEHL